MVLPNTTGSPLSADSLATFMAASMPKGSAQQLSKPYEAVALAVHAAMLAVGFRLIGLGEDDRIEAQADANNPQPLPAEWNAHSSYAFRYAHSESSMEFVIKVSRLGGKAVVNGIAIGDDKTTHMDLAVKDYISENSLPITVSESASNEDLAKTLKHVFISSGRLADLGSLFKVSTIHKLAPSLSKSGTEIGQADSSENDARRPQPQDPPHRPPEDPEPARPYPFTDPLARPRVPGGPLPEPIPGFEDEYEVNRPLRGGIPDGRLPGGLGHDDLYPPGLGPHDPIRPHFGGGLPRPGGMGGGMHPTFDDPLFAGQGQEGYDPMAPPGARYDPLGPAGGPRDGRSGPRFPGGGGGGFGGPGGRPPNPFGGFGDGDFI